MTTSSHNRHPIEIDSTILDAWCCLDDESMLPLGRPTLTIAIDVYTHMILGFTVAPSDYGSRRRSSHDAGVVLTLADSGLDGSSSPAGDTDSTVRTGGRRQNET
jgi:hypothetical protein